MHTICEQTLVSRDGEMNPVLILISDPLKKDVPKQLTNPRLKMCATNKKGTITSNVFMQGTLLRLGINLVLGVVHIVRTQKKILKSGPSPLFTQTTIGITYFKQ